MKGPGWEISREGSQVFVDLHHHAPIPGTNRIRVEVTRIVFLRELAARVLSDAARGRERAAYEAFARAEGSIDLGLRPRPFLRRAADAVSGVYDCPGLVGFVLGALLALVLRGAL